MNIIAIDPSLVCTALIVNDKKFIFAGKHIGKNETGTTKKWFKYVEELVNSRFFVFDKLTSTDHTENELHKLNLYDKITDQIVFTIISESIPNEDYIVGIEGYSYNADAGPLIDLVTFGTLLKIKLKNKLNCTIKIFPPTDLKSKTAQFTYDPIQKGKKQEWRNHQGLSGGSFKKPDMYRAIIDNNTIQCDWKEFLKLHQEEILSKKMVPKPIEDINDAKLMYELLKSNKY